MGQGGAEQVVVHGKQANIQWFIGHPHGSAPPETQRHLVPVGEAFLQLLDGTMGVILALFGGKQSATDGATCGEFYPNHIPGAGGVGHPVRAHVLELLVNKHVDPMVEMLCLVVRVKVVVVVQAAKEAGEKVSLGAKI